MMKKQDALKKLNLDVSRETYEKLEIYEQALLKWNKKVNLISKHTEHEVWERHILDCAQLLHHIPKPLESVKLMDVGCGAGLPGIILAILGVGEVTLVESNSKKTSFLHHVATLCEINPTIMNKRIEEIKPFETTIITARALASVNELAAMLKIFSPKTHFYLFLKGQNVVEEIDEATRYWVFDHKITKSLVNPEGHVVIISNLSTKESDHENC